MASTLSSVSTICYIAAAVLLLLAVVFFIALRIPSVFNDYTGRTARRKVYNLRAKNEGSANKSHQSSKVNLERGKVTQPMPKKSKTVADDMPGTALINDNQAQVYDEQATEMLVDETDESAPTSVLIPTRASSIKLEIIDEVMMIHTQEVVL